MERQVSIQDIPYGAKNAISRKELSAKWHMSDRHVRATIRAMRKMVVICSFSNKAGYFQPLNREEIEHFKADMKKKAFSILEDVNYAENALVAWDKNCPQPTLF